MPLASPSRKGFGWEFTFIVLPFSYLDTCGGKLTIFTDIQMWWTTEKIVATQSSSSEIIGKKIYPKIKSIFHEKCEYL